MVVAIADRLLQAGTIEDIGMPPESDEQIFIQQLINNDPGAWRLFVRQYRDYIYGVVIKVLKDEDQATDVTQEVFLLIHRNIHKFRGESQLSTWVYRIAFTTALMALRAGKRKCRDEEGQVTSEPRYFYDIDPDHLPDALTMDGIVEQERALIVRVVRKGIAGLSEKDQQILQLDIGGFSESEMTQVLGLVLSTVKTRRYRARQRLRRELVAAGVLG